MKKVGKPKLEGWERVHLMLRASTIKEARKAALIEDRSLSAQIDRMLQYALGMARHERTTAP